MVDGERYLLDLCWIFSDNQFFYFFIFFSLSSLLSSSLFSSFFFSLRRKYKVKYAAKHFTLIEAGSDFRNSIAKMDNREFGGFVNQVRDLEAMEQKELDSLNKELEIQKTLRERLQTGNLISLPRLRYFI